MTIRRANGAAPKPEPRRASRRLTVRTSESRSASRAFGKDRRQLRRGHDLELRVGAVRGSLVAAPAAKLRRVPKAPALQVIVADLDHELRPERLPGQILALTPAALTTWHPPTGRRARAQSP